VIDLALEQAVVALEELLKVLARSHLVVAAEDWRVLDEARAAVVACGAPDPYVQAPPGHNSGPLPGGGKASPRLSLSGGKSVNNSRKSEG
jgi:hypothetical protein